MHRHAGHVTLKPLTMNLHLWVLSKESTSAGRVH